MKVKELIEQLKQVSPDKNVLWESDRDSEDTFTGEPVNTLYIIGRVSEESDQVTLSQGEWKSGDLGECFFYDPPKGEAK